MSLDGNNNNNNNDDVKLILVLIMMMMMTMMMIQKGAIICYNYMALFVIKIKAYNGLVISRGFRKSIGWGNNNYDYNYVAKGHQRSQMERWGDLFIFIYIYHGTLVRSVTGYHQRLLPLINI